MPKDTILLARKIAPNYWEVKNVEGPSARALDWTPVPYSSAMSLSDVMNRAPNATVLDVTSHFEE